MVRQSVAAQASNDTATAPVDYLSTSGTLVFAPNQTGAVVFVRIPADSLVEPNKRLYLNLSNPSQAIVERPRAVGVIVDDDGRPGSVAGLSWELPTAPLQALRPLPAALLGLDWKGDEAEELIGTIRLSLLGPQGDSQVMLGEPPPTQSYETFGGQTEGYAFRPLTDILVTHLRGYGAVKVSLWQEDQTLLAFVQLPFKLGWEEVPLVSPLQLRAGHRYRLARFTGNHPLHTQSTGLSSFQHGLLEWPYTRGADGFPTETTPSRWSLVDLRYRVLAPTPLRVVPDSITNLQGNRWTGSLELHAVGEGLVLLATDGFGHTAESTPLTVTSPAADQFPMVVTDLSPLEALPTPGHFAQILHLQNLGLEPAAPFTAIAANLPQTIEVVGATKDTEGRTALTMTPPPPGNTTTHTIVYNDPSGAGSFATSWLLVFPPTNPSAPTSPPFFRRAHRLSSGSILLEFDCREQLHGQHTADWTGGWLTDWTLTGAHRVVWLDTPNPEPPAATVGPRRFYRLELSPP